MVPEASGVVGLWVVQKVLSCGFVVLDGFGRFQCELWGGSKSLWRFGAGSGRFRSSSVGAPRWFPAVLVGYWSGSGCE